MPSWIVILHWLGLILWMIGNLVRKPWRFILLLKWSGYTVIFATCIIQLVRCIDNRPVVITMAIMSLFWLAFGAAVFFGDRSKNAKTARLSKTLIRKTLGTSSEVPFHI